MEDKVLYSSHWHEIRLKDGWYEYTHSPWMNGVGVAVLAYKKGEGDEIHYLGRYEVTPCHSPEPKLCAITGGYDNADKFTILGCALNELVEEGGYDAPTEAVIPLGQMHHHKGSDTIIHMFAVDLGHEGVRKVEATGDGTRGEEGSYVKWVSRTEILCCTDPLNVTMLARLEEVMRIRKMEDITKSVKNKMGEMIDNLKKSISREDFKRF